MRILPAFTRAFTAAALGCLLVAPVAFAAGGGESTPLNLPSGSGAKAAPAVGPGGASIVRTIVGLAIVIGVIYGLHWILKQVKASRQATASGSGLEDLATLPLGTNRSLHLVRAGGEVVLVGVGEAGVTPIRTYTEDEARTLGLLEDGYDELDVPAAPRAGTPWGRFLSELRAKTVLR
ncbi:MAG TPA: flagellar biosynthetic protein FliO [Solirubrobacteraceae bacterium]